jgi:hypothetical protein
VSLVALFRVSAIVYPIRNSEPIGEVIMRLTLILAVALLLTPAALTARPAAGLHAQAATDVSAAKRKTAPRKTASKKAKAEYLKAAPGTGPSGPATKY